MKRIILSGVAVGIMGVYIVYQFINDKTILGNMYFIALVIAIVGAIFSYALGKHITRGDETRLATLAYIILGTGSTLLTYFFIGSLLLVILCSIGC